VDYYDWPPEAFYSDASSRQTSITVAATANTPSDTGGRASYSNYGLPFEIAAPGSWARMLNGNNNTDNTYWGSGTSFAAPTVAGVAALVASGNLATYLTPDGDALKSDLLAHDTLQDSRLSYTGSRVVTMLNLP
jgi:subtilisin family serine protease